MIVTMDAHRLGAALRSLRVRRNWRQEDLAGAADVSVDDVSRAERGHADSMAGGKIRAIPLALDAHIDYSLRWRGGDLDRLLNARHAAMQELVIRVLEDAGWQAVPEVSFSIFGERGVIDILAWHAPTRTLLIIELKTEIVDVSEVLGTFDRKRRLALKVAAERGWVADHVGASLAVAEGRTNRRRFADHASVFRAALPDDGVRLNQCLRRPVASIAAASFLSYPHQVRPGRALATVKRVRPSLRARAARVPPVVPAGHAEMAK
jgi:transcriptional regulator with XRE-family HTH domain